MPSDNGTQVNIFGHVYHIKGGDDTDHTRKLAALVDEKMNFIAAQVRVPDNYRIAVLTALHMADEYVALREEHDRLKEQVSEKTRQMESLIDAIEEAEDAEAVFPAAD